MRKMAFLILIVITLLVAGFFITKVYAETRLWHQTQNARPFRAEPNPSSTEIPKNVIPDIGESWYSPLNPNYRPDYYWYSSPQDDRWSNEVRNWWCQ